MRCDGSCHPGGNPGIWGTLVRCHTTPTSSHSPLGGRPSLNRWYGVPVTPYFAGQPDLIVTSRGVPRTHGRRWSSIDLMLARRLWRRAAIKPTLGQHLVFPSVHSTIEPEQASSSIPERGLVAGAAYITSHHRQRLARSAWMHRLVLIDNCQHLWIKLLLISCPGPLYIISFASHSLHCQNQVATFSGPWKSATLLVVSAVST